MELKREKIEAHARLTAPYLKTFDAKREWYYECREVVSAIKRAIPATSGTRERP